MRYEIIYSVQITKTYDSISGDALYYKMSLDSFDTLISLEIVAVCNPRFHYSTFYFSSTTPDQAMLPQYKMLYEREIAPNPQYGLDSLSCIAKIDGKTDTTYVTRYTELLIEPDGNFFDVIQQIVQPVTRK